MPLFYLDSEARSDGTHILHKDWCVWMPYVEHKISIGYFSDCFDALQAARSYLSHVNGCEICLPECSEEE